MTQEQLKQEHPDLYAALKDEFVQAGVKQERERVLGLMDQKGYDPENTKLEEVVDSAVREGKPLAEVQTGINVAIRDGAKYEGENAPAVQTVSAETDGLDDDDREAMKLLGMTAAEYKQYQGVE